MPLDETKRRRRFGPDPKTPDRLRTRGVSSRFSTSELADLDARRKAVGMSRGEYLRCAALGVPPSEIPELNREAWVSLSRAAGNLNQLAKRLAVLFSIENDGGILDALGLVDTVKSELDEFRDALIGADLEGKN